MRRLDGPSFARRAFSAAAGLACLSRELREHQQLIREIRKPDMTRKERRCENAGKPGRQPPGSVSRNRLHQSRPAPKSTRRSACTVRPGEHLGRLGRRAAAGPSFCRRAAVQFRPEKGEIAARAPCPKKLEEPAALKFECSKEKTAIGRCCEGLLYLL